MRPPGTAEALQRRRRRAIALLKSGETYRAVAAAVGASLSSVVRWQQVYDNGGLRALRPSPVPGRPAKLSRAQVRALERLLAKGPLASGYTTDLWTLKRIAKLIGTEFGIRYGLTNVWKVMGTLRWSWQKPERRALERNEEAIERWKAVDWPRIKKNRRTWCPSGLSRRERVSSGPQRTEDVGTDG